jgi:hypothetical protein
MTHERLRQIEGRLVHAETYQRDLARRLQGERVEQVEARLQRLEQCILHVEQEYHLHLADLQRAITDQAQAAVNDVVALSTRELLKTAEDLLRAAEEHCR